MATPLNGPLTGEIWHLSIEDLLQPLEEAPRLGGPGPFVINLSASSAPIAQPAKQLAEFTATAHVYQIQRSEDRRLRYRLRLGPFATEDEADAILIKVRDIYPSALTATAESDDLRAIGSLQAKAEAMATGRHAQRTAAPRPAPSAPSMAAPRPAPTAAPPAPKPQAVAPSPQPAVPTTQAAAPSPQPAPPAPSAQPRAAAPAALQTQPAARAHAAARTPQPVASVAHVAAAVAHVAPVVTHAAPAAAQAAPATHAQPAPQPQTSPPAPQPRAAAPAPRPTPSRAEPAPESPPVMTAPVRSLAQPLAIPVLSDTVSLVRRPPIRASSRREAPSESHESKAHAPKPVPTVTHKVIPTIIHKMVPTMTMKSEFASEPAALKTAPESVALPPVKIAAEAVVLAPAPARTAPEAAAPPPAPVKPEAPAPAPVKAEQATPTPALTKTVAASPAPTPVKAMAAAPPMKPAVATPAQFKPTAQAAPAPVMPAPASRPARHVEALDLPLPNLESTQTLRPLTQLELDDETVSRWFVIQLSLAEEGFDPDSLPNLDIFNEYRLYSVAGIDQGKVMHALAGRFLRRRGRRGSGRELLGGVLRETHDQAHQHRQSAIDSAISASRRVRTSAPPAGTRSSRSRTSGWCARSARPRPSHRCSPPRAGVPSCGTQRQVTAAAAARAVLPDIGFLCRGGTPAPLPTRPISVNISAV